MSPPPIKILLKDIAKCKHANSRRTKALGKKTKKCNDREKTKFEQALKLNQTGEKLAWFNERIDCDREQPLTPTEFIELMNLYINRFAEELEQIHLKQSISKNRAKQHISRESIIKMTVDKERNEFNGGGMDFINLCDATKFESFKNWNGNSLSIQHLRMDKISKGFLMELDKKLNAAVTEIIMD